MFLEEVAFTLSHKRCLYFKRQTINHRHSISKAMDTCRTGLGHKGMRRLWEEGLARLYWWGLLVGLVPGG